MFDMNKTPIRVFIPVKGPDRIMVNIKKYKHPTAHLTLFGGDLQECNRVLREIVAPYTSTFKKGRHINIEMREYIDGKNGKSTSFSFYTEKDEQHPEEVAMIIQEALGVTPVEVPTTDDEDSVI